MSSHRPIIAHRITAARPAPHTAALCAAIARHRALDSVADLVGDFLALADSIG